ncbi:MAG: hypothetical protein ACI8XB_000396 [Patiriisocius sp.]|jgi:hypothetical protein
MRTFIIIATALLIYSCSEAPEATVDAVEEKIEKIVEDNTISYGEMITTDDVMDMNTLLAKMSDADVMECKVKGEITGTCIKKGCWMTINTPEGDEMRVTFKDYGFFVPTSEQEGKTAIMRGKASVETTTVAELRHYAEDAGKSTEEIEAITEPETSLAFEADGVLIVE